MPKKIVYLDKTLDRAQALDWALVLHAMDIPYEIVKTTDNYHLEVPENFRKSADNQIRCYLREMRARERSGDKTFFYPVSKVRLPLFFAFPLLFYLFQMYQLTLNYIRWEDAGYSSADLVLKGQWWRTVTALTLHADEAHFFSNLFFGGVIAYFLCALAGEGLGWFLIILAGIGGNFLNALVYQTGHDSIGFSTSVFGAIGILTGMELSRKGRKSWGRVVLPLGAGLALFSLFGTDPRTDVSAHLFGLLCGLAIGYFGNLGLQRTGKPAMRYQIFFLLAAVGIIAFSWALALGAR
jgi:membrane associated rhomboid family serine protease